MIRSNHKLLLKELAHQVMLEKGLWPEFSPEVLNEISKIDHPRWVEKSKALMESIPHITADIADLRDLPWCSIDNDDSLDLDQLTVAVEEGKKIKILVAIAEVVSLVKIGGPIDNHARHNTTSVYTAAENFPMLPTKLSNDLTSLNYKQDRPAIIIEIVFNNDNLLIDSEHTNYLWESSNIYPAWVNNHAKLAYNSTDGWLSGKIPIPEGVNKVKGLAENIQLQDKIAQLLRKKRYDEGALDLVTIESRPVFQEDKIHELKVEIKNRAKELIEDFMIAANRVTANHLRAKGLPSLRRVVRSPKRWERIQEIAAKNDYQLPSTPDSRALALFLNQQKKINPLSFPDLSLTIIKLLGRGEYVVELPQSPNNIHFGLAVENYLHSTAPNRRYPDLITQRILKSILSNTISPYEVDKLTELAQVCTEMENTASKVERRVAKSAAALLLSSQIGKNFSAICTGASEKGTWVRIFDPPIEGKLVKGYEGIDVGNKLQVQLIYTDVERGFIDFKLH